MRLRNDLIPLGLAIMETLLFVEASQYVWGSGIISLIFGMSVGWVSGRIAGRWANRREREDLDRCDPDEYDANDR